MGSKMGEITHRGKRVEFLHEDEFRISAPSLKNVIIYYCSSSTRSARSTCEGQSVEDRRKRFLDRPETQHVVGRLNEGQNGPSSTNNDFRSIMNDKLTPHG